MTLTPVTANDAITIDINGEPAEAGKPKTITIGGSEAIAIKARLGERTRSYTIHLERNRPVPELLLHWTFDQTEADGIPDTSGKGHTGLMSSGADLRPGLDGNALYLNGARANVQMTNVEDLHPEADNFTFSVWVNPEALVQQRHIIYWYGLAGKYPQWWCAVEKNGAVRMNLFGMPAGKEVGVATAGGLVKTGVWTHLTFVRDGSVNKIYVNGEWAATSVQYDGPSMNVTNRSTPPLLGYDKGTAANRDWLGSMDELRMYRYALNDADIRRLYGSMDEKKPVTEAVTEPREPNGTNGWYTSDVTVTLSALDNLSGVARTEYRLNGGEWKAYRGPFAVTTEGVNGLDYRSMDRAGQLEETRSLTLRIDKTAPSLTIEPDPAGLWPPNGKWVPVRAAVDAADGVSGVASVTLVSITSSEAEGGIPEEDIREADFGTDDREFLLRAVRNGEGTGRVYTIEYKAADLAGNTASGTAAVTVRHDASPPPAELPGR
ncbi:hypothetical protein N6H14_09100 [Paenibacillus sp. CC-CFT747]|nr:hypothetical protein N6H14_09100 [Paenibacillus sp. CC-CFT747]